MQSIRTTLLAGVAALAAAGFSGLAAAQTSNIHTMTVRLPDGGTAQIRYIGDVAPQIVVDRAPLPVAAFRTMPSLFGADSPFAELERISAEMDRRAALMMRQAELLSAQPNGAVEVASRNLPAGAQSYTFVSTMSGNGVCTQSVQITSRGNGAPKVVRNSSGNCGNAGGNSAPADVRIPTTPAPAKRPDALWTKNDGSQPYAGMVQQAAARPR